MTRVTVDAATAAKLHGLGGFFEIYDERGVKLGHFEPDEQSPAFREWLRNLASGLTDEERERRISRWEGVTTEEALARLQGHAP